MALVLIEYYNNGVYEKGEPELYIDSLNKSRHEVEMINYLSKKIKDNGCSETGRNFDINERLVNSTNDIQNNDAAMGIWIVKDNETGYVTVYEKELIEGYIYNNTIIKPLYRAYTKPCPKVVPRFTKVDDGCLHDRLIDELKNKVSQIHNNKI